MTMRRLLWIFAVIGIAALVLAAAGQWLLDWSRDGVLTWLGIGAGYLAIAVLLRLMPRWWRDHVDEEYAHPAGRRYARAVLPIMAGYALTLFASIRLIRHGIASLPLRAVVAIVPALFILLLMAAALRYFREADELQRRIEAESIAVAGLGVSFLYFAGGLLQKAEVIAVPAADAMIWVFPLLMLAYGIAKFMAVRRYR